MTAEAAADGAVAVGAASTARGDRSIAIGSQARAYEVLGVARHSETLEDMVVYRALYGDGGLWVRPAAMWSETVEKDGYRSPRFVPVEDEK